jgi:hypothetical protein
MKHFHLATRKPQVASIDLNGIINAKVESKENVINAKASGL